MKIQVLSVNFRLYDGSCGRRFPLKATPREIIALIMFGGNEQQH
jgi:hypothetical protein